jgi:hypothetical protein
MSFSILANDRFNDGNQCGHVKYAGQSFTDHALKNGHHIHLEKESYGDVPDAKHPVKPFQKITFVGVEK